jgi:basic amino acid/polyamine antiporter, APA family
MAHDLGGTSVALVAAIALVSTTNTTLLAVTAASRLTYGMATQGVLPRALAFVHRVRRTPLRAILLVVLVAAAFVFVGELALIAAVTDFAVYVVFVAVNGAVIALRVRRPDLMRPFAVPGAIAGVPIVPLLGLVSVVVMASHLEPRALAIGAALVGAGTLAAWRSRAKAVGPGSFSSA